jgi:hypothetical protein
MRLSGLQWIASFFLAAVLSAPAWGVTPALPGTINYVEGQVTIGDQTLDSKSVGSTTVQTGQTVTTEAGKAELLLTPGVFFRLGSQSAATLVSPSLTNTEIALNNGQAIVEVDDIHRDNLLRVQQDGATAQLLKTGVYGFDSESGAVRVFKGEALVQDGDRNVKVKAGHELEVKNGATLKTARFDKSAFENSDLYRFSNLRSEYLAEANTDAARVYVAGGPGWFGPGWYWDPFFTAYTWIPGNGIFYSPFGWGFYSPLWVSYAPLYYRPYYPGSYVAGARPLRPEHPVRSSPRFAQVPAYHGLSPARVGASNDVGGFRGAGMAGAFHGGGIAGGFHR